MLDCTIDVPIHIPDQSIASDQSLISAGWETWGPINMANGDRLPIIQDGKENTNFAHFRAHQCGTVCLDLLCFHWLPLNSDKTSRVWFGVVSMISHMTALYTCTYLYRMVSSLVDTETWSSGYTAKYQRYRRKEGDFRYPLWPPNIEHAHSLTSKYRTCTLSDLQI